MRRIAITGGIAEGKSTVLAYAKELGYTTASSDQIWAELLSQEEVAEKLSRTLEVDARDRDAMRAAVRSPEARRKLNRIAHPLVVIAIRQTTESIIEVPLLIEACLQGEFDRVWVVTAGKRAQIERLRARGVDTPEDMLLMQLPTRAKIPFADLVIRTNEPEHAVQRVVSAALRAELG